jgi:putative aldouronate transport system substrate-binding protein
MKKKLRIAVLLTFVLFTVSTLGACVTNQQPVSTEGTQPTAGDATSQAVSWPEPNNMPISKEKINLTMFTAFPAGHAAYFESLNDSPNMKAYAEITGVNVDIQAAPGDSYSELKSIIFASGQLPDIVFSETAQEDAIIYGVNDNLVIPIDDLLAQYGYYTNQWMDQEPNIKEQIISGDDHIYYMPSIDLSLVSSPGCGYYIREEWLDRYNLEPPSTIDDLYNVLSTFKKEDPAGGGKTIPLSAPVPIFIINSIMGSFGVKNCVNMDGIYQMDGKVKFGPVEPEFKEALKFLNKLYDEELIAQDYLAHNVNVYYANLIDNVGMTWGWAGSGLRTPLLSAGYTAEEARNLFRPIAGAKGNDGKYHWYMTDVGRITLPHGEFITSSNKYPVETMKWLDYKNSQEGAWTVGGGPKGISWELGENGAPRYTDYIENNPDGLERDEAFLRNGGIIWLYTVHSEILENAPKWPFSREDLNIYGPIDKYPDSLISKYEATNWLDFDYSRQLPPTVMFSAAEKEEIDLILQDLKTFVEEEVHKFVMGMTPIDKWDDNVKQMNDVMDVERLIEIYQNALDKVN